MFESWWCTLAALIALASIPAACFALFGSDANRGRGPVKAGFIAACFLLLACPVFGGLRADRLLLSVCPSLAVVTIGACLSVCLANVFGVQLFQPREWTLWTRFVLVVGTPLYLSVFGLLPGDLYAAGYQTSWVYLIPIVSGLYFAWRGCLTMACLMLCVLAAHLLRLLPSENIFDAMIDGISFLLALATGIAWPLACEARRRLPRFALRRRLTSS